MEIKLPSLKRNKFRHFISLNLLLLFSCISSTVSAQINENFSSWTARPSYTNFTQVGSGGTWTMTQCIAEPNAAPNGVGSKGLVQMDASPNGVIELPTVVTGGIGVVTIKMRVSAIAGIPNLKIEKKIGGGSYSTIANFSSGLQVNAQAFSFLVNDLSSNITLKLTSSGRAFYIHDISTTFAVPCSGTPSAGNAVASATTVTSGGTTSLSLTGVSPATGLTYQWQESPNGTTGWMDIIGATTATYIATIPATKFFQCVVKCSNSGLSSASTGIKINMVISYCIPTGSLNCVYDNDYISNVTINTLNNSSTCGSGGYTNYSGGGTQTTTLTKGTTYPISLSFGPGIGPHSAAVYIDWNKDGDFTDAGEFYIVADDIRPINPYRTINITVPNTAAVGPTRMRIRYAWYEYFTASNSCTIGDPYGETEDYTVTITAPCVQPENPVGSINIVATTCGTTTVAYSGTNVSGGYWQTSPTGVDTSFPVSSTIVISTSSMIYVRTVLANCWSATNVSRFVNVSTAVPYIAYQPANAFATVPNEGFFNVDTSTTATSYQWQVSTNCGVDWEDVTVGNGATTSYYGTGTTTAIMNGYQYRVIAINACGSTTSNTAVLILNGPAAQNYTWTGAVSDNWNSKCNWMPNGIPSPTDNIIISTTSPNQLTIDADQTINGFSLIGTGSFALNYGKILTINGAVTYNSTATTTLHCASKVYFRGALSQNVPPITYGTLDIMGGPRVLMPGTITVCGPFIATNTYPNDVTGSTVNLASASDYILSEFNFNNLTISGGGILTVGYYNPENRIINVRGNYLQTAGIVRVGNHNSSTSTLNIDGNLTMTGGAIDLNYVNGGKGTINLRGNLNGNPTSSISSTILADANFNFIGSALLPSTIQFVNFLATSPNENNKINFNIKNNSYVQLANLFRLGNSSRIIVENGATLDFGLNIGTPYSITNSPNQSGTAFTANPGSTLKITSKDGINLSGSSGNVQTTARNFALTAPFGNYHYIGKGAQVTGTALPPNVSNLLVNNVTNGVDLTLSQSVSVINNLSMLNGNIVSTTTKLLELGQSTAQKGNLNYTEGYVKGPMKRWFSGINSGDGSSLFPFGTVGNKNRFLNIEYTTAPSSGGSITATINLAEMGVVGLSPIPLEINASTNCLAFSASGTDSYYYNLTASSITGGIYTAKLRKESAETIEICNQTILNRDGSEWLASGSREDPTGTAADFTLVRSGLTVLKDLGIGQKCSSTVVTFTSGTPTSNAKDKLVFAASYSFPENTVVNACECTINSGATVTVTKGSSLAVQNQISILGANGLIINDGGSLVQYAAIDNATQNNNGGSIKMIRDTKPMYRYSYTYWSSPIFGNSTPSVDAGEFSLFTLSNLTLYDKYWKWGENLNPQNWELILNGAEAMIPARGYIIRAPQTYQIQGQGGPPEVFTANFIGKPNNGDVKIAVVGDSTVEKWNLLGNPYPSAVDATKFLQTNQTQLGGTIYFWTHNSALNSSFQYDAGDYASWNLLGGTATAPAVNNVPNNSTPSGYIAAGQSFFARGVASGEVIFTNKMRVLANNSQFFKYASNDSYSHTDSIDRHRVWLNMRGSQNGFNQLLVGYITDATNEFDIRYDGDNFGGNLVTFYSVLQDKNLVIQGRALPFNSNDHFPLGYKVTAPGTFIINIDHADGLLASQNIYLQDNQLNLVHHLNHSEYEFSSLKGTFNDRFVLRYTPMNDLDNPSYNDQVNGVFIRKNMADIFITSPYDTIDTVSVFDIAGRLIFQRKNCDSNTVDAINVIQSSQTLIVKVLLANGAVVTKKVL